MQPLLPAVKSTKHISIC